VDAQRRTPILDREQLRDITLNDEALMREILDALIDDTSRQMELLRLAISDQDAGRCARLAHYSKGACANVGASAAAAILKEIETKAAKGNFVDCRDALSRLTAEVELLRSSPLME